MSILTCNLNSCLLVVALASSALAGCTPAATNHLDWVVANTTADTLRVVVQYPLDSTLLSTPAQLANVRQQWAQDSGGLHGLGYYNWPLSRLARHHHHWYWVQSPVAMLNGYLDTATDKVAYVHSDRLRGIITYTLAPHSTQRLLTDGYTPGEHLPPTNRPILTRVWLQQGAARQLVFPLHPLDDVFRPVTTGQEYATNAYHRVQLTVGPGLTINP